MRESVATINLLASNCFKSHIGCFEDYLLTLKAKLYVIHTLKQINYFDILIKILYEINIFSVLIDGSDELDSTSIGYLFTDSIKASDYIFLLQFLSKINASHSSFFLWMSNLTDFVKKNI